MRVNKTFSTSNNFDDLFMCTFTADSLTTFFTFNPPKLGNKQENMLPELHLETSFNTLEKKESLGKQKQKKPHNHKTGQGKVL